MRHSVDILVADDSDEDAGLTLAALRRAAPEALAVRVKDGRDARPYIYMCEANIYVWYLSPAPLVAATQQRAITACAR